MSTAPHGTLPALVLLPGIDGTGKRFSEFVRTLGARVDARIVAYPKDRPMGYAELETLVLAALPRTGSFILVGESFSGPIAMRIAARAPAGLAAVILCATFAKNPFPWLGWARPLAAWFPLKSLPRWVRSPLMWGSASPRRAPAQTERAIAGVSPGVVRRRIAELLTVDDTAALRRIRLPTLVLAAKHDHVLPRAATRWILQTLPSAELVEIDGPHVLLQARPAECAAIVLRFLESQSIHCHSTPGARGNSTCCLER